MTSEATQRKTRLQKYIVEEAQARERLSTFPEAVRQRLTKWQESQSEWFGCTVLEIVAEFITFDDAAQSGDGRSGAIEAYLIERLEGEGFGPPRRIVDGRIHDPTSDAYWVNIGIKNRHRVTPLAALNARQSGEGEREGCR